MSEEQALGKRASFTDLIHFSSLNAAWGSLEAVQCSSKRLKNCDVLLMCC
jgi:hypothetical protein